MNKQEWKPVAVTDGKYEVSNYGRVRNVKTGKTLEGLLHESGYIRIGLQVDGVNHKFYVHRLVAEAFIGKRPEGMDVNHLNGYKTDNRATNLEYCTRAENMKHARRLGLHDNRGEKQWNAKLTEDEVGLIRIADSGCGILDELIQVSDIPRRTLMDVIERKTWRHLP